MLPQENEEIEKIDFSQFFTISIFSGYLILNYEVIWILSIVRVENKRVFLNSVRNYV